MLHKEIVSAIQLIVDKRVPLACITGVFINAKARTLTMTDMDIALVIADIPVEGTHDALVDADTLQKILRATKKQFSIKTDDKGAHVLADDDAYALENIAPPIDFPELIEGKPISTVQGVPMDIFRVSFAASKETSRYYLCGVHLDTAHAEGQITAVATNGHFLALRSAPAVITGDAFRGDDYEDVIVPNKSVKAMQKLFADTIDITLSESRIVIRKGNYTFITKLIDGTFPDYTRVIPAADNYNLYVDVNKKDVLHACSRDKIVDGEDIHLFGGTAGYWVRLKGKKSTYERKMSDGKYPDKFETRFRTEYMKMIAEDIDADNFSLGIVDAQSPMRIKTDNALYVLMPVRV